MLNTQREFEFIGRAARRQNQYRFVIEGAAVDESAIPFREYSLQNDGNLVAMFYMCNI